MSRLARLELETAFARPSHRTSDRRLLKLHVSGRTEGLVADDVVIHDISRSGLLIETSEGLPVDARLEIELPVAVKAIAAIVWNSGNFYGCKFEAPISVATLSAAQLKSLTVTAPPAGKVAPSAALVLDAEPEVADKLDLGNRLRVITSLAIAGWAIVLTPIFILWRLAV